MTDPTPPADRLRAALADRYTLERELGAGGMATVWLATDLKHQRHVALKVLRPELAATLGSERFLREITIIANLQHPHILPLHDSGVADGFLYYVMPYIEGPTLRTRLLKERELPVIETVRILRDVADALAHAHAQGVVHRDLKPENIMLSGRHALVADFGVAKAVSEARGSQTLTTKGVALGTPTYMAPEQATADPLTDHRADIYALGVMAYEMLTGDPPFVRHTPQALLAAHLAEAPVEVTQRRDTVPSALGILIMRCLAKKPADRPQRVEEVLEVLETLATPSLGMTPAQTQPMQALSPWRRRVAVGVGFTAVAAAWAAGAMLLRPDPLDITVTDIQPVTTDPGPEWLPALSPDGNEVAYVAGREVVIRPAETASGGAAIRIEDPSWRSVSEPVWTSDGRMIRFRACPAEGPCGWREVGRTGGAVRAVTLPEGVPLQVGQIAWSADGTQMAYLDSDTLFVASESEGVRPLLPITPDMRRPPSQHSIAWSPDAERIAFVSGHGRMGYPADPDASTIWVVDVNGGEASRTVAGSETNLSPTWLDEHRLMFVSNRDGPRGLYVMEVGRRGMGSEPRLVPGVSDPYYLSYSAPSGRLAFAKYTGLRQVRSYPLDPTQPTSIGDGERVFQGNEMVFVHDISPDGRWIAYEARPQGNSDIYKMPLPSGEPVRLTSSPRNETWPRWSPDGREIAFTAVPEDTALGETEVYVMSADGGTPTQLTRATAHGAWSRWPIWFPDGLGLSFVSLPLPEGERDRMVTRASLNGPWSEARDTSALPAPKDVWGTLGGGSFIAVDVNRGDVLREISLEGDTVWTRAIEATTRLQAWGHGMTIRSSADGRTLYCRGLHKDGTSGIWAIPDYGRGEPREIVRFDDPYYRVIYISVGPDRLYLTLEHDESDIWVATLKR